MPLPTENRPGDRRRARHRACDAKKFFAEGWRVALLDIEGELLGGAVASRRTGGHAGAELRRLGRRRGRRRHHTIDRALRPAPRAGNNAGIAVFAPLLESSNEDWNRVRRSISPVRSCAPRRQQR